MTLDGKIALPGDQRQWITSERSRALAHFLRIEYDAMAVGANTVILDNPTLNVRDTPYPKRHPYKVVFDPQARSLARLGTKLNLLASEPERVIWILNSDQDEARKILADFGVQILKVEKGQLEHHLDEITQSLTQWSIRSLLLEGGAGLYHRYLEQDLCDRMHLMMATDKMFGNEGLSLFHGPYEKAFKPVNGRLYTAGNDVILDLVKE